MTSLRFYFYGHVFSQSIKDMTFVLLWNDSERMHDIMNWVILHEIATLKGYKNDRNYIE